MSSPDAHERGTIAACLRDPHHAEVVAHLEAGRFFWLDLEDPSEEKLHELARLLRLHPLTLDDVLNFHERPSTRSTRATPTW